MIKLKDLLNEVSTVTKHEGGDEAGQIWPFSKKKDYAHRWEKDRIGKLLSGPLLGMIRISDDDLFDIMDDTDEADLVGQELAGDSGKVILLPKNWIYVDDVIDTPNKITPATAGATKHPGGLAK